MCDTVVIVEPDRVVLAKNSGRDANEAQQLEWHPPRIGWPGAQLACTWVRIPDVERTHAVLLSRPTWMWGAEMGSNEHGVTIGNEAVFTTEPHQALGLTGMDLVRLALERATTAAEAVEVITSLIERHGQGGNCGYEISRFSYHNTFAVADPTGAFVLDTAGRKWQAERLTGVRTLSNALAIPDFARAHQDRIKTHLAHAQKRQARTESMARAAGGLADVFAILRDHGAPGALPRYGWLSGGAHAPCMHAGGLLSLGAQSTASWVSELRPGSCRHWATATSAPCTGLFKPVAVDEPVDLGPVAGPRADRRSLWWRHERFHRAVMGDPRHTMPLFAGERDAVEAEWLTAPPSSAEAFARADELLASWQDAVDRAPARDRRPVLTRWFWRLRNASARLPQPPRGNR